MRRTTTRTQNSRLKTGNRKPRTGNRKPLVEGIRRRRPRGFFKRMSDKELVSYAKELLKEKEISGRRELEKSHRGLYEALRKRKILDNVGFVEKRRPWKQMKDDEIIQHAKTFMKEKRISGRKELYDIDGGLYDALRKRRLLDRVGFEDKILRLWKNMEDEEIIGFTKKFMKEKGISGRSELYKADPGLYDVLRKRGLLDKIDFVEGHRPWKKMKDEELIQHARKFMTAKGISRRSDLSKADHGLYSVLRVRKLLDRIGFEDKIRKMRPWKEMDDEEIVEYARRFMKENGINGRHELNRADRGLYFVLKKRGLLDKLGFGKKNHKRRFWKEKRDEEIIEYARKFMKEKGITGRTEFLKADAGLYFVLRKRGLRDKLGFEEIRRKYRFWKNMKDEEVIEYAKEFMENNGINTRSELSNADRGLYYILRRRKLLNLVFSSIEQSASEKAIEQIIDFTAIFGGRR